MKKLLLGLSLISSVAVFANSREERFFLEDVSFFQKVLTNEKVQAHLVKRIEGINTHVEDGNYQFLGIMKSRHGSLDGTKRAVLKYGDVYNIENQRCITISQEVNADEFIIGEEKMCLTVYID